MESRKVSEFYKYFLLFLMGGAVYYTIEILWRGHSHPTMYILGGLCYICIGLINEIFPWKMYIEVQAIIGAVVVLLLEFIAGCVLNLWLGLGIWDYSNTPMNILGQVCLPYGLLWIILSIVALMVDDWMRYRVFGEERPHYRSFILRKTFYLGKNESSNA